MLFTRSIRKRYGPGTREKTLGYVEDSALRVARNAELRCEAVLSPPNGQDPATFLSFWDGEEALNAFAARSREDVARGDRTGGWRYRARSCLPRKSPWFKASRSVVKWIRELGLAVFMVRGVGFEPTNP